jgi:hypothetical protein
VFGPFRQWEENGAGEAQEASEISGIGVVILVE